MPLTKSQKQEAVESVRSKFKESEIMLFANFHGLNVAKSSELRRALRKNSGEYLVTKKTLAEVALRDEGVALPQLEGEAAFIFGKKDAVSIAKTLYDFAKKNIEAIKILGGYFEGKMLDAASVTQLAKIPPREILIAQFMSVLQAPQRNLVGVLGGNIRGLVQVLGQIKSKK